MPQTYMRAWPGSSGVNGSRARDSVLYMRRLMTDRKERLPTRGSRSQTWRGTTIHGSIKPPRRVAGPGHLPTLGCMKPGSPLLSLTLHAVAAALLGCLLLG